MLTAGFVLPHAPFVCSREDFDTYDALVGDDDLPEWQDQTHPELLRYQDKSHLLAEPRVSRKDQRRARVAYYGMCASLDRQVRLIIDAIATAGLTDDTIIVYTSDHGEQLGEHGLWWKHTFYEGSVGVPMIFAGPGVPSNQTLTQNVSLIDLGQTLLDMTGSQLNPTAQGRSFAPLFKGDTSTWDDTVLSENLWPPGADCLGRMIKQGPWKLNHYHGYEPQLFNLDQDPGENHDRAADPACASIHEELMTRVSADWDHVLVFARQKRYIAASPILRQARDNCDMPEPDKAWLRELKIRNRVDTSR
jgi:choline-sulfatase